MANTVSTTELANFLGVHRRTIQDWTKQGCPIAVRVSQGVKGGHQFIPRDVMNWLKEKAVSDAIGGDDPNIVSAEEAKRRKILAEAGLQEIELAKKKGDVIDLAELERKLSNSFAIVRSNMLKVPDRTAIRLVGETDEVKIKRIIREEVTQALEALANWNSYELEEFDDDEQI